MLLKQTHPEMGDQDPAKEHKWTDNRKDEVNRQMSIKAKPFTIILPDSRDKSYLFNFMDTPGHPNFSDEVTAGLRLSDGIILVVDCIEGVTFYTEALLRQALRQQLDIIVVINKIDRFVIELKLPPNDAYHKIKHTLDEINFIIQTF
jgi:U5 small nuclear ribonucleoprotein component